MKRLTPSDQGGNPISNIGSLALNTVSGATYSAGKLVYDIDNDCLTFFNSNSAVSLQVGQEEWIRVTNSSGATITNGSVVYISGSSSGLPTIGLAKADSVSTAFAVGIVTADITNGANGFVTTRGLVRGINTSSYTAGQALYLSAATAGTLTTTQPAANFYQVLVATAITINATTGTLYVQPQYNGLGPFGGATFITVDSASTPKNLINTGNYKLVADGNNGFLFDLSGLGKNNWNMKCGSDGTFLFDQGGGNSARFKLGGTTSSSYIDFTPDYSNSYFKVRGDKQVTTANNTLDDGTGKASFAGGITPRINSTASSATPAINVGTTDQFEITALAVAITSMTSGLTGTPVDGQKLIIRIKDNGTARAITWGTSFTSSGVATLLATTVANKTHMIGLVYDSAAAKWVCMAVDAVGY